MIAELINTLNMPRSVKKDPIIAGELWYTFSLAGVPPLAIINIVINRKTRK
jgi:hypothetical protein